MKRLISLLSLFSFVLVFNNGAIAQQSVNANAEVVAAVTEDDFQAIDFATIPEDITGSSPEVDPTDVNNTTNISGTPQVGYVVFSGTASSDVTITNTTGATDLTGPADVSGNFKVQFQSNLCYDDGDTSGNTDCQENNPDSGPSGVGTYSLSVDGSDFSGTGTVWIGGQLNTPRDGNDDPTASLASGTYSGSISISIDYTF